MSNLTYFILTKNFNDKFVRGSTGFFDHSVFGNQKTASKDVYFDKNCAVLESVWKKGPTKKTKNVPISIMEFISEEKYLSFRLTSNVICCMCGKESYCKAPNYNIKLCYKCDEKYWNYNPQKSTKEYEKYKELKAMTQPWPY